MAAGRTASIAVATWGDAGGTRVGNQAINRPSGAAANDLFFGERKVDIEIDLAELFDFRGTARFLGAEIVRRDPENHQAALTVAPPQFLQGCVLVGVAAERSGVDDQDRFAGKF